MAANLPMMISLQLDTASAAKVAKNIESSLSRIKVKTLDVKNFAKTNAALNDTSQRLERTGKKAEKFWDTLEGRARSGIAFTLINTAFLKVTGAVSQAVRESIKYEAELLKISQVTGDAVAITKSYQQTLFDVSKEYNVSISKVAQLTRTLTQTGLTFREAAKGAEILSRTSLLATFDSLTSTTEGLIAVMQTFNLTVSQSGKVLEQINDVSKAFAVESSDIVEAIRRTGGAFSSAGGQVDELIALFTSVRSTSRESAETIATGFRTIFGRLQRPKTIEYFKQLGIQLQTAEGQFIGPLKAIEEIGKGLDRLGIQAGSVKFAQVVEQIGGIRQISRVVPLLEQYRKTQQALDIQSQSSVGTYDDIKKAQQGLGFQVGQLKQEFVELISSFVNSDSFKIIAKTFIGFTRTIISLTKALKPVLPLLTALFTFKIGRGMSKLLSGGFSLKGARESLGFATGGMVPGSGNGDTVPAMLTPGEFVIRKSAVQAFGADRLASINKYKKGGIAKKYVDANIIDKQSNKLMGFNSGDQFFVKDVKKKDVILSDIDRGRGTGKATIDGTQKSVKFGKLGRNQRGDETKRTLGWQQFEDIIESYGYTKVGGGSNYPIDFTDGKDVYDAKHVTNPVSDDEMVKKSLHHVLSKNFKDYSYTNPSKKIISKTGLRLLSSAGSKLTINDDDINADFEAFQLIPKYVSSPSSKKDRALKAAASGMTYKPTRDAVLSDIGQSIIGKKSAEIILPANERIQRFANGGEAEKPKITYLREMNKGSLVQEFMAGGYAKPVSPKQLAFLKSLVEKNGVPEGFEYPPKTSAQASALIDRIKNPPKQGLDLNSLFKEYQQIFGMPHPQANDIEDSNEEDLRNLTQSLDRTIEKYNKFANVIKEYYGRIIHQDSWNGSFYALGGPNPRRPNRAELDQFVNGGFDRNLLEQFGTRGDAAFGSSVNAPRGRSSSALKTRKSYMRGYAEGGVVEDDSQLLFAAPRQPKRPFGIEGSSFPKRISNAYFRELDLKEKNEKIGISLKTPLRKTSVRVDESEMREMYDSTPLDLEKFKASFKERLSRNSLIKGMSYFAKFVGLPSESIMDYLPQVVDFNQNSYTLASAYFDRKPSLNESAYNLENFGWSEAHDQDMYGIEALIQEKQKEIKRIIKKPVRTFEDGSFLYDTEAFGKANDELYSLKNKLADLKDIRYKAVQAARDNAKDIAQKTGRGTIGFNPLKIMGSPGIDLYHELGHQLLNSFRTRVPESFDKYRAKVISLFEGDNDDVAMAIDALPQPNYNSADIAYGRSYKIQSLLSKQLALSMERKPENKDLVTRASEVRSNADAITDAKSFKDINPIVNSTLGMLGVKESHISKLEDMGKEEFLTTLLQNYPILDSNLNNILQSTLDELFASGGVERQRFANGGSVNTGTDTVPALLTPGEFVINKKSAQAFGYDKLHRINKYADGGVVDEDEDKSKTGKAPRTLTEKERKQRIEQYKSNKLGTSLTRGERSGGVFKEIADKYNKLFREEEKNLTEYFAQKLDNAKKEGKSTDELQKIIDQYKNAADDLKSSIQVAYSAAIDEKRKTIGSKIETDKLEKASKELLVVEMDTRSALEKFVSSIVENVSKFNISFAEVLWDTEAIANSLEAYGVVINRDALEAGKTKGAQFSAASEIVKRVDEKSINTLADSAKGAGSALRQFGKTVGGKWGSAIEKAGGGLLAFGSKVGESAATLAKLAKVAGRVLDVMAYIELFGGFFDSLFSKDYKQIKELAIERGDVGAAGEAAAAQYNQEFLRGIPIIGGFLSAMQDLIPEYFLQLGATGRLVVATAELQASINGLDRKIKKAQEAYLDAAREGDNLGIQEALNQQDAAIQDKLNRANSQTGKIEQAKAESGTDIATRTAMGIAGGALAGAAIGGTIGGIAGLIGGPFAAVTAGAGATIGAGVGAIVGGVTAFVSAWDGSQEAILEAYQVQGEAIEKWGEEYSEQTRQVGDAMTQSALQVLKAGGSLDDAFVKLKEVFGEDRVNKMFKGGTDGPGIRKSYDDANKAYQEAQKRAENARKTLDEKRIEEAAAWSDWLMGSRSQAQQNRAAAEVELDRAEAAEKATAAEKEAILNFQIRVNQQIALNKQIAIENTAMRERIALSKELVAVFDKINYSLYGMQIASEEVSNAASGRISGGQILSERNIGIDERTLRMSGDEVLRNENAFNQMFEAVSRLGSVRISGSLREAKQNYDVFGQIEDLLLDNNALGSKISEIVAEAKQKASESLTSEGGGVEAGTLIADSIKDALEASGIKLNAQLDEAIQEYGNLLAAGTESSAAIEKIREKLGQEAVDLIEKTSAKYNEYIQMEQEYHSYKIDLIRKNAELTQKAYNAEREYFEQRIALTNKVEDLLSPEPVGPGRAAFLEQRALQKRDRNFEGLKSARSRGKLPDDTARSEIGFQAGVRSLQRMNLASSEAAEKLAKLSEYGNKLLNTLQDEIKYEQDYLDALIEAAKAQQEYTQALNDAQGELVRSLVTGTDEEQADLLSTLNAAAYSAMQGSFQGIPADMKKDIFSIFDQFGDVEIPGLGMTGRDAQREITRNELMMNWGLDAATADQLASKAVKDRVPIDERMKDMIELQEQKILELLERERQMKQHLQMIDMYQNQIFAQAVDKFRQAIDDFVNNQLNAQQGNPIGDMAASAASELDALKTRQADEMKAKEKEIQAAQEAQRAAEERVKLAEEKERQSKQTLEDRTSELRQLEESAQMGGNIGRQARAMLPRRREDVRLAQERASAAGNDRIREQQAATAANERVIALEEDLDALRGRQLDEREMLIETRQAEINATSVSINGSPITPTTQARGGVIYAANGQLVNYEPRGTDTVPAMLTPGEFVMRKSAVDRIGVENLERMNRGGVLYAEDGNIVEEPKQIYGEMPDPTALFGDYGTVAGLLSSIKFGGGQIRGSAGALIGSLVDQNLSQFTPEQVRGDVGKYGGLLDAGIFSYTGGSIAGAQIAGMSPTALAAAYGLYTATDFIGNTVNALSNTDEYFKGLRSSDRRQLNQSFLANAGENLLNSGRTPYQLIGNIIGLIPDAFSAFTSSFDYDDANEELRNIEARRIEQSAMDAKQKSIEYELDRAVGGRLTRDPFYDVRGYSQGGKVQYLARGGRGGGVPKRAPKRPTGSGWDEAEMRRNAGFPKRSEPRKSDYPYFLDLIDYYGDKLLGRHRNQPAKGKSLPLSYMDYPSGMPDVYPSFDNYEYEDPPKPKTNAGSPTIGFIESFASGLADFFTGSEPPSNVISQTRSRAVKRGVQIRPTSKPVMGNFRPAKNIPRKEKMPALMDAEVAEAEKPAEAADILPRVRNAAAAAPAKITEARPGIKASNQKTDESFIDILFKEDPYDPFADVVSSSGAKPAAAAAPAVAATQVKAAAAAPVKAAAAAAAETPVEPSGSSFTPTGNVGVDGLMNKPLDITKGNDRGNQARYRSRLDALRRAGADNKALDEFKTQYRGQVYGEKNQQIYDYYKAVLSGRAATRIHPRDRTPEQEARAAAYKKDILAPNAESYKKHKETGMPMPSLASRAAEYHKRKTGGAASQTAAGASPSTSPQNDNILQAMTSQMNGGTNQQGQPQLQPNRNAAPNIPAQVASQSRTSNLLGANQNNGRSGTSTGYGGGMGGYGPIQVNTTGTQEIIVRLPDIQALVNQSITSLIYDTIGSTFKNLADKVMTANNFEDVANSLSQGYTDATTKQVSSKGQVGGK